MLVCTVTFVDMYIDVRNLAFLVLLPRANQEAQFPLFTKIYTFFFLIRIPQIGVSLSYFLWTQKPSFLFEYLLLLKKFSLSKYVLPLLLKNLFFSDKGVLKTKLYQVLFKKSRGACFVGIYIYIYMYIYIYIYIYKIYI